MKNKLLTLSVIIASAISAQAVSTINWEFGALNVAGSGALADGQAVYLIASTTGAAINLTALETSLVGMTLNVGSIFDTDLMVLGKSTPDINAFGEPGTGNGTASNISYVSNLTSGDSLGLLWLNQADGVIGNNVKFGLYISPTQTMPSDPSSVTRSFLEEAFGGSITDGSLTTTNVTIPEPSLGILSAFAALALLRRKR